MRFLFLHESNDSFFVGALTEILAPLGSLKVARANGGVPLDIDEPDGLIIIDAATVDWPERLVARLRLGRLERRIIVLTASPTWERARAAFEAGAIDYLPQTLSADELREAFQQAMCIHLLR